MPKPDRSDHFIGGAASQAQHTSGLRCLISIWLIGSLLLPPCTGQQPAPSDWQRVRNLPRHTTIMVQTKTRDRHHGELVNVTADSLSLDSDERAFPGRMI